MPLVIAICGMAGAGKSEAREYFESKDFAYIHLGSTEATIEKYGKTTEELERKVRLEIREKHGMGGMAVIALPKIDKFLAEKKDVVIDNMYSWSEYKIFKKKFGSDFFTIAIHASPKIRYQRQMKRKHSLRHGKGYNIDLETCQKRDYAEIEEIEKGGPIAMADFHYVNEGSKNELKAYMEKTYDEISSHNQ